MPSKAILGLIAAISSFKAALSGRTNESPPVFYRTSSPSGPLPKKMKKEKEIMKRKKEINQSPKGNMWSAIPFALLCMIVNLSERKQGSGPEGDEVL